MSGLRHRELSQADLREFDYEVSRTKHSANRESKVENTIEDYVVKSEEKRLSKESSSLLRDLLDISPLVQDAAAAIVDDSFLRCFQSQSTDPWNWNIYLFPLWTVGMIVRYLILFPLRLIVLLGGFLIFFILFSAVHAIFKSDRVRRSRWEQSLVQFQCQMFVASWTGVVRYHGPRPVNRPNHVWVCNHTSMIDYIILCAYSPFAVIMQLHPGWVGFLQTQVLNCLGCLWFNRTEVKDRLIVAERMKAHVQAADTTPLLIFPEGTCVNNEYCVMFKRGAFDLGATVCPIAIKYNKIFVDAFWNSKRQSFTAHLGKLMTSWAVVCDVYFLEPQTKLPEENAQQFAERVQKMIAERAKLQVAPWDGYLKYYTLGVKHPDLIEKRRKVFGERIARYIRPQPPPPSPARPPKPPTDAVNGTEGARQRPVSRATT
ncbi:hypothetical protein WJX75_006800 [Coccomyxa subellipsoidea]|uniref:Phospholipid/glycerol acyltransferase domain-containing protein n=1 Tax=Coccomyxa subellipsoidea TaxID=248742 RepID=A0ABR2YWJ7_9CHLO